MNFIKILPRKLISHWAGILMHIRLPRPLSTWSIEVFAKMYNINLQEAEKTINEYTCIGDFFTRHLKAGARPIGEGVIVHPADSVIVEIGSITEGKCFQAKGRSFSVENLLQDSTWAQNFKNGMYVVYYLCPTDYHRVHSPMDAEVFQTDYHPGHLWPVNLWARENVENLFAVNERVVLRMQSRLGPAAMVFVGATNVGKIQLSFDAEIVGNACHSPRPLQKKYSSKVSLQKGQEAGLFSMGSTIVMLYNKEVALQRGDWEVFQNQKVKMGENFL